ncbi:XRE family transcriptional regulator [Nocardiopsis exhalans]|uniref:XRE family transcriptional regulator n=1 Tax=Nocardiopsis exhalans TaxID=163604 RepID=A0ABY5D4N3_9ACTN|nr:XRE family transcriptional regulator [Nocardiopsis exhalans]USY18945.1 XRE family transcriptional regulator [Nocardiopsis exhalans]
MVLNSTELGLRVSQARQRAGLTQAELSQAIGVNRSVLAKMENGSRRLTALELAQVAEALGERIEWFVEDTPPAIVSHRNVTDPGEPSPRIDAEVERRVRAVEFVARNDTEFRDKVRRPPEFPLPGSREEADKLAREARELLGVGQSEPLHDLGTKVIRAGLLPFIVNLGRDAADAASVLLDAGAVAVVNGGLRVGRRRLSLAHELGHVLVADDYTVDWRIDGSTNRGFHEQLMDQFARSLLLPDISLEENWDVCGGNTENGLRTAAVRVASHFRVDMSTLARRLRELELISGAQAAQVRTTRTTKADIVEHDLVSSDELPKKPLPRVYEAAVLRLFTSEKISEERALDLLMGTWETAELPELPKLNESAIWQFVS